MAILHKSVLGTFTNKVGGVVGASWKGIPVVRSLPASVANPRTTAQMTQRTRFLTMIQFASLLLNGWIRPLWNRDAKKMSGYNAFVRANMKSFNGDGEIVLAELMGSRGRLQAPTRVQVRPRNPAIVEIEIDNPTKDNYATANDEVWAFIFDPTEQRLHWAGDTGAIRGNDPSTVITLHDIDSTSLFVMVAYRHPRGIFVSHSNHFDTSGGATVVPSAETLLSIAQLMKIDTSNIDTSIDEASAIAVLKEAIKEKAAMNTVKIESKGDVHIIPTPDRHEFDPVGIDMEVEKVAISEDYDLGELGDTAPMGKRGGHRGNR